MRLSIPFRRGSRAPRLSSRFRGSEPRRPGRALATVSLAAVSLSAAITLITPQVASAAPGNPGVPSAPSVVYQEDFQNRPGPSPIVRLSGYTGATGQTYTADPAWLKDCNGWIASSNESVTAPAQIADCNNLQSSWNDSQRLAQAIGMFHGQTAAAAGGNFADTAYTSGDPGAPKVEFQTATNIPFVATNRFLTFSVDVAANNCFASAPLLQFSLLDSVGTAFPAGSQIDGCTGGTTVTPPALGVSPANPVNVGTYTSNGSVLFSGTSVGVQMVNNNGSGAGNDHTVDNIQILDVTPQLDKSFSPALTRTGESSTLTFTVTNTSELGSKNGWSFTDNLPSGLTLANSTVGGTCNATTAATAGGSSIEVTNGNLAQGEQSCTITVQVTSTTAGTYNNCPTTNVSVSGLNQPACASVRFADPTYTVQKTASQSTAKAGDTITYTLTVTNTGEVAYTADRPATLTDDLAGVTDDATYNGDASNGATVSGNTLSWSGPLAVGDTQTITYSVKVINPDTGDHDLANKVTPTGEGGSCATDGTCITHTPVAEYTLSKSASATSATPGDTVTYTVTVRNTGQVAYTATNPASFSDDLSAVTDDATYNGDADNGATVSGNTLTWSGPLAVGDSIKITYSFVVNQPDTGDKRLNNAVTPTDPTGRCVACGTEVPIGTYTIDKSVDKATAVSGDKVTWTVTVTNTGNAAVAATFSDDLGQVLDDATYNSDAKATAGVVSYTAPKLSWAQSVPIGGTVTITYSATVNTPDTGDHNLKNAITSPGCVGGNCSTDTTVWDLSAKKVADKSAANPGDTVKYTITVKNTGKNAYTADKPATFSDNLSQVLDDATYNNDSKATAGAASYTAPTLSWSGALAVGATATITYTVKVNDPDAGDQKLGNAVVTPLGRCVAGSKDPTCTTDVPVTSYTVTKTVDKATVAPGDKVTWTITVKNTGSAAVTAKFSDDLTQVLDDATYNNDAKATAGNVTYTAPKLAWSQSVPVGGTVTITYSATVNTPDTGDHKVKNTVTSPGCAADCSTQTTVGSYTVTKTVDKTTAAPGDKVAWTITVKNTGSAAVAAKFSDDLTQVLDDATYNNDAKATAGNVTYTAPKLAWSQSVPVGGTVTITYSATVNTPDNGDHNLLNAVESPGSCTGTCSTKTTVDPAQQTSPGGIINTGFGTLGNNTGGSGTIWAGIGLIILAMGAVSVLLMRRRRHTIG
ncbi:conserved repeat domain-containing protein/fimbrial isopeptide formation D2 domain-containing protein [Nakamurella panacisegetis]|uniref:Conserved repeat domain-containing protein/fimbrial isopeptide formation D2 domain-containing protein n=1 Tax=Nakamurella panacisegetis TaxID=1090615 RepID=A0A1H0LKU5_9ACTN|nr:DUF11 domain-containing protein [Nakamurella panacisegetis]SDO68656.1 conserved repeat domain-containing protein/fimbrial isopeptide formation D2 domain-containing protein [Nakamurella panacisegetis]